MTSKSKIRSEVFSTLQVMCDRVESLQKRIEDAGADSEMVALQTYLEDVGGAIADAIGHMEE